MAPQTFYARRAVECLAFAVIWTGAAWLTFRASGSPVVGVGMRALFQLAAVAFTFAALASLCGFGANLSRRFRHF